MSSTQALNEARKALHIDQLVLAIHDASFPSAPGEDVGRGSPYSRGAHDLLAFARGLGFTGVQLGPQGETTLGNRSPYDGTVFAKSVLSLDLHSLAQDPAWEGLVDRARVSELTLRRPEGDGVHYPYVFHAIRAIVGEAWARFGNNASMRLRARYEAFRCANAPWLDHDEAYESVTGGLAQGAAFAFGQFLVHAQHDAMRAAPHADPWTTYGDLQAGLSMCDRWGREAQFLAGYAMGAPPSRTDPYGQAWGYPVFDPGSDDAGALLRLRVAKMVREMDGLRIDHPHGIVCPWVYDSLRENGLQAVQRGARLRASPDVEDHPTLAPYAIARPDQLDRTAPRYADGWVRDLEPAQVDRYASRFDALLETVQAGGRHLRGVVCEVLSTQPYPLRRVMERHQLGRFRVTQKANPLATGDVYRAENASPPDWMMVGNHDTPPLRRVLERWREQGIFERHARYLEERLCLDRGALSTDADVTKAMFANLFCSPARNVMVFAPDLLGLASVYNRPGVVDDANWTWRVPPDFRDVYRDNLSLGAAMNIPHALAMALRAHSDATRAQKGLIETLERS